MRRKPEALAPRGATWLVGWRCLSHPSRRHFISVGLADWCVLRVFAAWGLAKFKEFCFIVI